MEGDDTWEEAALNTRHMHNRNDRGGRGNIRESFQIRNTFGTHLVKCPALERLQGSQSATTSAKAGKKPGQAGGSSGKKKGTRSNSASGEVVLDIYRLTDDEDGVLGSLKFPGVFEAAAVFAGSRKVLGNITRHLGQDDTVEDTPYGTRRGSQGSSTSHTEKSLLGKAGNTVNGEAEEESESDEEESSEDEGELSGREKRQKRRLATFEKNSFRQPKFWFRWQGVLSEEALATLEDLELEGNKVRGSGYVVFSGNDCRRFQGTMTSEQLGWNNVKMTGWKAKPQPERDFEIQWTREP